ncbi:MAG: M48 family metallopeptidase [Myxococcota bacterium]
MDGDPGLEPEHELETDDAKERITQADRVILTDISSLAWEHPADQAALNSLRQVPGFDAAVRRVFGMIAERTLHQILLGSSVEINETQYPKINHIYEEILDVLDAPQRYPLFVTQSAVINGAIGAVGVEKPMIVLRAGSLLLLSDEQLRVLIAREVSHVLSDHVLYKTMLRLMVGLSRLAFVNVFSGMAYTAIMAALMEWDRKSALSADRAALLATQDPEAVRRMLLRKAGGLMKDASVDAFKEQASRYKNESTTLDSIARALALLNVQNPLPVERLTELEAWIASGNYQQILDGEYVRRSEDPGDHNKSAWTIWKETANAYAEEMKNSPAGGWFRGLRERLRSDREE